MNDRHRTLPRAPLLVLLTIILLPLLYPAGPARAANAPPARALLLYDSLGNGTEREGNIAVLERLLASGGIRVTEMRLDHYAKGRMEDYPLVVAVGNNSDLWTEHKVLTEDVEAYRGKYLHIGFHPPDILRARLGMETGSLPGGTLSIAAAGFHQNIAATGSLPYIASASGSAQDYGTISLRGAGADTPYAVWNDRLAYVPYFTRNNIGELALAGVLRNWLDAGGTPGAYLVIEEIYPFTDLDLLKEMADRLYGAGMPFVASVRPVFANTDFPAMLRYHDTLRYIQSRNGSIIVNAPVVKPPIEEDNLEEKMKGFVRLLADNGIAPLGIGAELYWAYDKQYASAGMSFFDSALLYPDETVMHQQASDTSAVFASAPYVLDGELLRSFGHDGEAMPPFPLETAVVYNMPEDKSGLERLLAELEDGWTIFNDYKSKARHTTVGRLVISSSRGLLSIGGQPLSVDYSKQEIGSDYQYATKSKQSFTRLFNAQNRFFIVVILISLVFFGVLLLFGYRLYRRKYLK